MTRWVALMIQLGKFVGVWVVWWLTPTTYIQLAGAGSTAHWGWINNSIPYSNCCHIQNIGTSLQIMSRFNNFKENIKKEYFFLSLNL